MKDYKRLMERRETPFVMLQWADSSYPLRIHNKPAELENKIECGEIDYVTDKDKEIARLTAENERLRAETAKEIGNMLLNEVIQSIYTPDTEIVVDKQFLKDYIKEKYGVCLEER